MISGCARRQAGSLPHCKQAVESIWVVVALLILLLLPACTTAPPPAWEQADAEPIPRGEGPGWEALAQAALPQRSTGSVTAVASVRPPVPNVGVQLPVVSPDGRWIAFLDQDDAAPPAQPDDLVTGRNLGGLPLWVRAVDAEGPARNVAVGGVAWPAWSADSKTLAFVGYDDKLGCTLGLHDVASGVTRRKAVGLRHMMMPAISPDGRRVALAAYGNVPDQALVFTLDLATDAALPGPPATLPGAQILPRWLDDDTLVYVQLGAAEGSAGPNATLMRWTLGGSSATPIVPLHAPASVFDAQHLFAAIARPVSPDGRSLAYLNLAAGRIELVNISNIFASPSPLPEGYRAGAWWGERWFVAADDRRIDLVELASPGPDVPAEDASADSGGAGGSGSGGGGGDLPRLNLLDGRWVPLWADAEQQSILLIGESDRPDRFSVLQLWVVAKRDGE